MSKTFNLAIPFDFLLQAIAKLSQADKQRLRQFLDTDADTSPDLALPLASQPSRLEQTTFHQALEASGLVRSVRPPAVKPENNFQPIPAQGEAVSQTILDERR
jgi:hypothetical protein